MTWLSLFWVVGSPLVVKWRTPAASHRVIQHQAFDLLHLLQALVVADESGRAGVERRGDLDGVRRAEAIAGSKLGGLCRGRRQHDG